MECGAAPVCKTMRVAQSSSPLIIRANKRNCPLQFIFLVCARFYLFFFNETGRASQPDPYCCTGLLLGMLACIRMEQSLYATPTARKLMRAMHEAAFHIAVPIGCQFMGSWCYSTGTVAHCTSNLHSPCMGMHMAGRLSEGNIMRA